MELKQQVAIGASATIGALLLFYSLYKVSTYSSAKKPKERSKARKLLSKYNPRPSTEDILEDNEFNGRIVHENQVSEGGILYHDIRYKDTADNSDMLVEEVPTIIPQKQTPEKLIPDNQSIVSNTKSSFVETENIVAASSSTNANAEVDCDITTTEVASNSETACNSLPNANVDNNTPITHESEMVVEDSRFSNGNDKENLVHNNSPLVNSLESNGIGGGNPSREDTIKTVIATKDRMETERRRDNGNVEVIQQIFNIPSKAVGKIIGKEGRSIKGIQRDSGATLKFPSSRDRSLPTQRLFVSGTLRQVEKAVSMLKQLMPSDSVCHDLLSWTPQRALSGDLQSIELIENTVCIGRVTHVKCPESVWVQVCRGPTGMDYVSMLATMCDNITDTIGRKRYDLRNALVPAADIKEGTSCAVMLEGRAYRGTVICPGTPDNDVHQVRLVDFGTPHSFTELYTLSSYFYAMPALAVECSLAHIGRLDEDPVWPEGAAAYLEETLADCFVKVKTLDTTHTPLVELYVEPSGSNRNESLYINRELVMERYAKWVEDAL